MMQRMPDSFPDVQFWDFEKSLDALSSATNRVRFECCLDLQKKTHNMRSIRGHGGVPRIERTYYIRTNGKYNFFFTGSSNNFRSIAAGGLIVGGTGDRRGRQAWFFSTIQYNHCSRPDSDSVRISSEDRTRLGKKIKKKKKSNWHIHDYSA